MNTLEIFSIPKAANFCGVHRGTFWKYVKEGKVKASRTPGGKYRIQKNDLLNFMTQMGLSDNHYDQSTKPKILIVDDDVKIQKLIHRILSKENYQTAIAIDGFDAGNKLNTFKPDLLILDLFMPGLNGIEVCRRVKSDLATSNIKIIAMTGFPTKKNKKD